MRTLLLCCCCYAYSALLYSQENIAGVINDYAIVNAIDYCENTLELNSVDGFLENSAVILIQMTGASINSSNTAAFGDVNDLGNTGYYEKCRIQSINGNIISLENPLLNQYDLDAAIQLVSMPEFEDVLITETLTAAQWNGQTGGVLALEVIGTLTMDADIDVSALGFEGGPGDISVANDCSFITNANDYFYDINNWRGAQKGRGIADFITDRETGRGAQANGGGGGNDHNSGGGGGANLSDGGRGGENREPSFFGCDGNFPGEGGKAIEQDTNRIYMGGGGGAGHENNNLMPNGGRGGGILILEANFIIGNNRVLLANGQTANSISGDGAGGGGAGGTIVLISDDGTGTLQLEANGGNGGEANNGNDDRCMGPGGGGSGGSILLSNNAGLTVITNVAGGQAGRSINSSDNSCPDGTNGAQAGQIGETENITSLPQSTETNAPPSIISQDTAIDACEGETITLSVDLEGFQLELQWQINTGNGFMDLDENMPYSNTSGTALSISPVSEDLAGNEYRLLINSECFEAINSAPINLTILPLPTADFNSIQTGALTFDFTNLSTNANSYLWDFGDNNSSTQENPQHTYAEAGNYTVLLTVFNACDTLTSTQNINIEGAPTANFSFTPTTGCAPLMVQYTNQSTGNASNFAWIFDGGAPAFSLDENPIITYNNPGSYNALLIVSNASGTDSLLQENIITVQDNAIAGYNYTINDLEVVFTNTSQSANNYTWDFGDTNSSIETNPSHTFSEAGSYTVSLTATGPCGSETFSQTIMIGAPPLANFSSNVVAACAPFPVQFFNESMGTYESINWSFPGGMPNSSTEDNPVILYSTPGNYSVSLSIDGTLGANTSSVIDYLEIVAVPEPDFSFIILDGGTVIFNNASTDADSYSWDFGDGNNSNEESPVHTYSSPGVYTVSLNASNPYCAKAISIDIAVMLTSTENLEQPKAYRLFPNPSSGLFHLNFQSSVEEFFEMSIYTSQGQLVYRQELEQDQEINLSTVAQGIYLVEIKSAKHIWVEKLLIKY